MRVGQAESFPAALHSSESLSVLNVLQTICLRTGNGKAHGKYLVNEAHTEETASVVLSCTARHS